MNDGPRSTPASQPDAFTDETLQGQLRPEDLAALEALIDAHLIVAAVPQPLQPAASRVAALLGLLDGPSDSSAPHHEALAEGLVDATLARVRRADFVATQSASGAEPALTDNDEDALDALVSSGYESDAVTSVLRRRARRHEDLLSLLHPTTAEVAGNGTLIGRTLNHVQSSIQSEQGRLKLTPSDQLITRGRRFRLTDLVTVAALVLIAGAAIGPMVGAMREQSRRVACQSGLQAAGIGFASYAAESQDSLPMASASIAGNPWWMVGRPEQSNSANLYTLTRTNHVSVPELACAGNRGACRDAKAAGSMDWRQLSQVSYSYQNLFGRERPTLTGTGTASPVLLVVDASPVVRRAVQRLWINPLANSTNHNERGQNALMSDGQVQWLRSPVLKGGENIWLPHFIEQAIAKRAQPTQADPINGTETPQGADDVFVGP